MKARLAKVLDGAGEEAAPPPAEGTDRPCVAVVPPITTSSSPPPSVEIRIYWIRVPGLLSSCPAQSPSARATRVSQRTHLWGERSIIEPERLLTGRAPPRCCAPPRPTGSAPCRWYLGSSLKWPPGSKLRRAALAGARPGGGRSGLAPERTDSTVAVILVARGLQPDVPRVRAAPPDRGPADVATQAVLDQDPRVEPVDAVDQRPRRVQAARPEGLQHGVDGRVRQGVLV